MRNWDYNPCFHRYSHSLIDSIVSSGCCPLRFIHFPSIWHQRYNGPNIPILYYFRLRYNHQFLNRNLSCNCSECNTSILTRMGNDGSRSLSWGLYQQYTCYDCLKIVCDDCRRNSQSCHSCGKVYCDDCALVRNAKCETCSKRGHPIQFRNRDGDQIFGLLRHS